MSDRGGMPASYDNDISREPEAPVPPPARTFTALEIRQGGAGVIGQRFAVVTPELAVDIVAHIQAQSVWDAGDDRMEIYNEDLASAVRTALGLE